MASPYSGETTSTPQKASTLCQALQFLVSLSRLLSHIRVQCNEILCGDLCSIILPWSGRGARKVSPVLVSAGRDSVWCFRAPSSPQQHIFPGMTPFDMYAKHWGSEAPLFTVIMPRTPVTKAFVSNVRAAGKAEKGAQSLPALLQQASTWRAQERSVQGKRAINCNVTGCHDLLCFVACSLVSKALRAKLGLTDKVLLLCFSAWPF